MTLELSPNAVPDGWTQITVYDEQTGDRIATVFDEAYAALFKAAPDLLSALAELLDDTQWEFEQDCKNLDDEEVLAHVRAIRERAEAAVAKARGEN